MHYVILHLIDAVNAQCIHPLSIVWFSTVENREVRDLTLVYL